MRKVEYKGGKGGRERTNVKSSQQMTVFYFSCLSLATCRDPWFPYEGGTTRLSRLIYGGDLGYPTPSGLSHNKHDDVGLI